MGGLAGQRLDQLMPLDGPDAQARKRPAQGHAARRVGMQHRPDLRKKPVELKVQAGLRRRLAAVQRAALGVHGDDVAQGQPPLVQARGGDGDATVVQAGGEVAAGGRRPAAGMEGRADRHQFAPGLPESHEVHAAAAPSNPNPR